MEIRVEINERFWSDRIRELEGIPPAHRPHIKSCWGSELPLSWWNRHSIERSEGKARRIIDNRHI